MRLFTKKSFSLLEAAVNELQQLHPSVSKNEIAGLVAFEDDKLLRRDTLSYRLRKPNASPAYVHKGFDQNNLYRAARIVDRYLRKQLRDSDDDVLY